METCIEWGNNVIGGRERAKHMDIRKHFTLIQNGQILLVRVSTASQLVDIFTKGLHCPHWQTCVKGILGKTFKPSQGTSVLKRGGFQKLRRSSKLSRRPLRSHGVTSALTSGVVTSGVANDLRMRRPERL